jgi:LVIVD repeat
MHHSPGVVVGCANCHGGNAEVRAKELEKNSPAYDAAKKAAHVLPNHPEWWKSSANPERTYTKTLKESAEFIRFINPGDLRVAEETCGACHAGTVRAVRKSLMTTSAMLLGGASYNNNILKNKVYNLGEGYDREGNAIQIISNPKPTEEEKARGVLEKLIPLPQWESVPPGDNFRIFERGGERVKTQFPEIGLPNILEIPGKPDVLQSNRGPGTGARISVPVLNIHKTRLNDPHLSFMGTNDHPGDYRSSGCSGCHVVYANDRTAVASGPYAKFGHEGKSYTLDPTIPKNESGHPIKHEFSRGIPTSQCMVCHMHQPNMFVNSYLGYTMWDYEADAPSMWPEKQKYPTTDESWKSLEHNPEEAAIRGLWTDLDFLKHVSELNPKLKSTQFADYHGHGWNFRAVFSKDRKGNLLDKKGEVVSAEDPKKFSKAVHMMDIHAEKGMHCADCHFSRDSHGDGNLYGEVAQAVEIGCVDCHGTVAQKATLKTTGPAAPKGGTDLSLSRTPFGAPKFEWQGDKLIQRSNLDEKLEWVIPQVRDAVDPGNSKYNPLAAKAKLAKKLGDDETKASYLDFGSVDKVQTKDKLAHDESNMSCFTCHTSWATSCGGCHLPIQANWKQESKHYDGKETRNWATYNPQVVRDEMFQIGRHGPAKGGRIVPVRSSSALVLSSTDINRQKIYIQQPPVSAGGYSSQAFAPHFPHTVRSKETKQCNDCHLSAKNDNNAIMAQLLLQGTNYVNFMGFHAYTAIGEGGFEAVQVTEWDEPQAVIGSYLHKYAYPDYYKEHQAKNKELKTSHHHSVPGIGGGREMNTIQLRGEYLFTTSGAAGFRIYDVANIANKGFSEKVVTAPFSPLGHDTHLETTDATSFALPTNQPVAPFFEQDPKNLEQKMHDIYHYAFIVDRVEGLIVVNVDTMMDRDRTNNFLERSLTWNPDSVLSGARHIQLAGSNAFIGTEDRLLIVDLGNPLEPKLKSSLPFRQVRSIAVQFRYAFVVDANGFHVVDITEIEKPKTISSASISLPDARGVYLARTYAYVAGGKQGLVIVDI